MYGRPTWTDWDEAGDYVVPNVLSPRDLVFRPDNIDETVPHTDAKKQFKRINDTYPIEFENRYRLACWCLCRFSKHTF